MTTRKRNVPQTERQEKLAAIIQREIATAEGGNSDEITANRERALAAYNVTPLKGDAELSEDGWSVAQDTSVRDMLQAVLSQLMPMLSTDAVVQFEPMGADDEDAARAESAAVEYVMMSRNNGFIEFEESFHDGLLLRNGWSKIDCETSEIVTRVPLDGNETDEVKAVLLNPRRPNEKREETDKAIVITRTEKKFLFNAVPVENILFNSGAESSDIDKLRFHAELMPDTTRSDLVERGIPKAVADQLPSTSLPTVGTEGVRSKRNRKAEEPRTAETRDQDKLECYNVHIRADCDGDGISELYRCLYVGRYVFEDEEVDCIPYATGSPFLNPHRITGQSLYDNLAMLQDTNTGLIRRMMDNASVLSYGRFVGDPGRVNFDDLLGGSRIIRSKDPTGAVTPLMEPPDITPSLLAVLQYQGKRRTEAGGASLEMNSAELQVAGETAHGVERQTALREMLASLMAKNLSETLIRRSYLLMHKYLREFANEPIQMKLRGEWVTVDPRQWPNREHINVKAGKSAGEKSRKMASLTNVINLQIQAMQAGMDGIVTDLPSAYNAMMDWAAAAEIDNPDLYFINPKSPQAQQAQQAKQQQAQQQMQQQQQVMMGLFKVELQKIAAQIAEKQQEIAFKYFDARLKSETEEMKLVGQGTIDLERTRMEGERAEREATRRVGNGAASHEGAT